jgi:hypothetical protein
LTTLAQFRSVVSSKVGLDNTTAGDQGFIDLWVNEGVTDVLLRTDCRVRCATLTLTAGTWKYTVDAAIMKIMKAWLTNNTGGYELERMAVDDIVAMQLASATAVSPAQYYGFDGSDFLVIYPTPSTADTLNIFYVPRPATLSLSSDTPSEIPSEYQKAVEFYALREAADMSDDGTSQMGMQYLQLYEQWIKRIKKWVQMRGSHRLPTATVRSTQNRLPFHDNSRYPS